MFEIQVHPHELKHGLIEKDILEAWSNYVSMRNRDIPRTDQIIAIGVDRLGRLVQMVGVIKEDGVLIYHAVTPPTNKLLMELGWNRR